MSNLTLPLLPFIFIFANMLGTNNLKMKEWSHQPRSASQHQSAFKMEKTSSAFIANVLKLYIF